MALLEAVFGGAWATAIETAGSIAAFTADKTGFKQYLEGCVKRARAGRSVPGNHDLVRGVRTAHLAAVRVVLASHASLLAQLPAGDVGSDELAFAESTRQFVDDRLKFLSAEAIDHDVLSDEDMSHLLEHAVDPAAVEGYREAALQARQKATTQALKELEDDAKRTAPALFAAVFRGGNGGVGWHDAYSLWVAEEIKTNERFRSIFFTAELVDLRRVTARLDATTQRLLQIEPALQSLRRDVDDRLGRIEHWLSDLCAAVRVRGTAPFVRARIDGEGQGLAWQYIYRYAKDEMRGRGRDFAAVQRELFGAEPGTRPVRALFRWHVLVGGAGMGKSRFALEFLERQRFRWKVNGFVDAAAIDEDHAQDWPVEHPSLLVVDDAAAGPGLAGFVRTFAERANAGRLAHPVRLLLLDRSEAGFNELMSDAPTPEMQVARVCGPAKAHMLKPLDDDDLVALMLARIGKKRSQAPDANTLLDTLRRFDKGKRPLFAAIVADAIADQTLPDVHGGDDEHKRLNLFRALVGQERERLVLRLKAEGLHAQGAQKLARRYETLAALATLVRGIDAAALDRLYDEGLWKDDSRMHIPAPMESDDADALRPELHNVFAGAQETSGTGRLAPVEPDLIGERLVIRVLLGEDGHTSAGARWLVGTAWSLSPYAVAAFVRLLFQDYADCTERLGYLLPSPVASALAAKSALVRALANDLAAEVAADQLPSATVVKRSFALAEAIDDAMRQACQGEAIVARNVAAALHQVVNIGARSLSNRVEAVGVGLDPELHRHATEPVRLTQAFDQAMDSNAPTVNAAAEFALHRLPGLLSNVHALRALVVDAEAAGSLGRAMRDGIVSYHWSSRHVAQEGGLAGEPVTDADQACAAELMEQAFEQLDRPGVDGAGATYALTLIGSLQFARYAGEYDLALSGRIVDSLNRLDPGLMDSAQAVTALVTLCRNNILALASSSDLATAARQISQLLALLRTARLDWDVASRRTRSHWLIGQLLGALLLQRADADLVDSVQMWHNAVAHPAFADLEDGHQQDRIDAASSLILGWQKVAPQRTEQVWLHVARWCGRRPWDLWSRRDFQIGPLLWCVLQEAHAPPAVVLDALRRLDAVFAGPPERPDRLAAALGNLLRESLPRHEALPRCAATVCRDFFAHTLTVEPAWAEQVAVADAWTRLMIQLALDGASDAIYAAGAALAKPAASSLPLSRLLRQVVAMVAWFPAVVSGGTEHLRAGLRATAQPPGGADDPTWQLAEGLAQAALHQDPGADMPAGRMTTLQTLDRELSAVLLTRAQRSGRDNTVWLVGCLDHLQRLLLRTPSDAAVDRFGAAVNLLPREHRERPRLEQVHTQLSTARDATRAARAQESRLRREVADKLHADRPPTPQTVERASAAWRTAGHRSPWPFEPLFAGAWQDVLDGGQATAWVQRAGAAFGDEGSLFSGLLARGVFAMRTLRLSFHKDSTVVELLVAGQDDAAAAGTESIVLLFVHSGVMYLDGTSPRLHRYHAEPGVLDLDSAEQAADYLRFFCGAVQGSGGPFTIVEDARELELRVAPGKSFDAKTLEARISPLQLTALANVAAAAADQPAPLWEARTFVHYESAVFAGHFAIRSDGMVEMLDDDPIWAEEGVLLQPRLGPNGLRGWAVAAQPMSPPQNRK